MDISGLITSDNFALEAAMGRVPGVTVVNKFGHAPDGVQTSATDIWGRADATPTQQIWLAPTAARVHAIVSGSASDDGDPVGVGARTIRVYGLTSWSSRETSEDITLNGQGAVNTVNAYVIIHRMKVLTCGATNINVGTITATAATDSSVTAVILAGKGQTQLAVYGIPSNQSLYIQNYEFCLHDITGGAGAKITGYLLVNENPNVQVTQFLTKSNGGANTLGSSTYNHHYDPLFKIAGPAIIKLQAISSAADMDVSASFDGYLVDN